MVRDKRRARAHARLIYALAQADSEDDFARWSANYAKTRRHYGVTLRAARDLLGTLGEMLDSMEEELAKERIAAALKALEGAAAAGNGEAAVASPSPTPAEPPLTVGAVAPIDPPMAPVAPLPLHLAPASDPDKPSPWARQPRPELPVLAVPSPQVVPAPLETLDALAGTANAVVPPDGSPLPFSGALRGPPPAVHTEPNPDMGFTTDLAPGQRSIGADPELEAYAWACAMREASLQAGPTDSPSAAADEKWDERFRANFPLFRRFKKLLEQYRAEIAQRPRC